MREHVYDERGMSQISKVSLKVGEPGAVVVVDLAHAKLGNMSGGHVEACWGRITRGTRTHSSQYFPKFVSLQSGRPQNWKRSLDAQQFAGLLQTKIRPIKRAS